MKKSKVTLAGINIQSPWSELLISGEKSVETRGYPIPSKHIGVELAVIETPGPLGSKKARIIGTIVFGKPYRYKSRAHWASEHKLHLVSLENKKFAFQEDKAKWAWPVVQVRRLTKELPPPKKRGIVFASACSITG